MNQEQKEALEAWGRTPLPAGSRILGLTTWEGLPAALLDLGEALARGAGGFYEILKESKK